jgi:malate dehydrogenase (oxaloacetate-decarboxylating)(NADP+)
VVDERLSRPILIGRPDVIERRLLRFGLRMRPGQDFDLINPQQDARYRDYCESYHRLAARSGVTEQYAKIEMRRRHTLIGAMAILKNDADGDLRHLRHHDLHLRYIDQVIGRRRGCNVYAAMNVLMLPGRQLAMVDTRQPRPDRGTNVAEITVLAAEQLRRLGIEPAVALVSHSNFGSFNTPSALKMRAALDLIRTQAPLLEIDGEMHADCAVDDAMRRALMPFSTLKREANLIVCPNIEAANIAYNLLKATAGNNIAIGPILLGRHVRSYPLPLPVRRIISMTALTVLNNRCGSRAD